MSMVVCNAVNSKVRDSGSVGPPKTDYHPLSTYRPTLIGRKLPLRSSDSSLPKRGVRGTALSGERRRGRRLDYPILDGVNVYKGDPKNYTITSLLDLWFAGQRPLWSTRRAKNVECAIGHLKSTIGDTLLVDFNTRIILKAKIAVNSRSDFGVYWKNFHREILHYLCDWLLIQDLIPQDYSRVWRPIPIKEKDLKRVSQHFTREEITQLVNLLPLHVGKWVWAACLTGQRRANLYPPTFIWGNISEDWFLKIPAKNFKQGRSLRFPICSSLQAILGPRGAPEEPVIQGLPHPCSLGRVLKRAAKKVGLDPNTIYPHNFRRTCLYWLKLAGTTRDQAQELFGWSSNHVMLKYYWPQQEDSEKRSIVDRL